MCIQNREERDYNVISPKELEQEKKEYRISRECKWFSIRFFNRRTMSGDRTRYVFVDESRYGIVWPNVLFFIGGHMVFFFAMIQLVRFRILGAWIYGYVFGLLSSIGITSGVHRLWSHKAYKATVSFRILLAMLFTATGQNDIYTWARDHRLHHKYTETDADPHNSRRGAFFAHVGWLLTKKHPDVIVKGKTIDNSDLLEDPVVYWNKKLYVLWYLLLRIYIPTLIPMIWYDQEFRLCILGTLTQYMLNLHSVWFVNSAAHIFGDRPYNSKIQPRENIFVAIFGLNEGFHNFHHQFPWDYTVAEFGLVYWDPARWLIEIGAKFGFVYDLKRASPQLIESTKKRYASIEETSQAERQEAEREMDKKKGHFTEYNFYVHDHPYFTPHEYTAEEMLETPFHRANRGT